MAGAGWLPPSRPCPSPRGAQGGAGLRSLGVSLARAPAAVGRRLQRLRQQRSGSGGCDPGSAAALWLPDAAARPPAERASPRPGASGGRAARGWSGLAASALAREGAKRGDGTCPKQGGSPRAAMRRLAAILLLRGSRGRVFKGEDLGRSSAAGQRWNELARPQPGPRVGMSWGWGLQCSAGGGEKRALRVGACPRQPGVFGRARQQGWGRGPPPPAKFLCPFPTSPPARASCTSWHRRRPFGSHPGPVPAWGRCPTGGVASTVSGPRTPHPPGAERQRPSGDDEDVSLPRSTPPAFGLPALHAGDEGFHNPAQTGLKRNTQVNKIAAS